MSVINPLDRDLVRYSLRLIIFLFFFSSLENVCRIHSDFSGWCCKASLIYVPLCHDLASRFRNCVLLKVFFSIFAYRRWNENYRFGSVLLLNLFFKKMKKKKKQCWNTSPNTCTQLTSILKNIISNQIKNRGFSPVGILYEINKHT